MISSCRRHWTWSCSLVGLLATLCLVACSDRQFGSNACEELSQRCGVLYDYEGDACQGKVEEFAECVLDQGDVDCRDSAYEACGGITE